MNKKVTMAMVASGVKAMIGSTVGLGNRSEN